jgi:hypothetical protein
MLTPEEQQRIEEEEKRRIAEEQYRAEVRTRLQQPTISKPHTSRGRWIAIACFFVLVAVVVTALIVSNIPRNTDSGLGVPRPAGTPSAPSVRYVPVHQQIATGQVVVKARNYMLYNIQIEPDMRDAHISGSYTAAGGSGNDVAAVIATQPEFANWINGHQARVFYGSEGRKTTDTFDVRLGPGLYCFAISNTFALLSDKYVVLDVSLNYQKIETR